MYVYQTKKIVTWITCYERGYIQTMISDVFGEGCMCQDTIIEGKT